MEKVERKYICVRDKQGGEFALGRTQTAEEWRQNALQWCEQDDNEEYARFLKKLGKKHIVGEIASMWDLEIIPIEELPIEDMWKLIELIWYNEVTINALPKDTMSEDDKMLLETIVNSTNAIFGKAGADYGRFKRIGIRL